MKKVLSVVLVLLLVAASSAKAQFYIAGDDPGYLKWNYIHTPNYKVIYPRGLDSLARVYAKTLETYRTKVGLSAGYLPGQNYWCKTPVVLHSHTGQANGSVAWAPMRMDLYTLPDAYNPQPLPWEKELGIHENRHVAQLQFGADGWLKVYSWLLGEMSTDFFAGVFPSYWMVEGDAVVAETALSASGRGRNAAFLADYMPAFDRGDMRNWEKWRWGSWRNYAPNHYALGYLTVAGARYLYNDPLFTSDYLHLSAKRPLKFSKVRSWFKSHSGKSFDASFQDIMDMFKTTWNNEAAERKPYMDISPALGEPSWYTKYSGLLANEDGSVTAIKSSFISATNLVRITGVKEETIRAFSSTTGTLAHHPSGGILWTETLPDKRWSLAGESRLRLLKDGKISDLTKGSRHYNPSVGPDGTIAVTEYPFNGGSAIVLLSAEGKETGRFAAPSGLQFTESAWLGRRLVVCYIGPDGCGLSFINADGSLETLLPQEPVSINHLKEADGKLYFISDRNGIEEVYSLASDGKFLQETSSLYGITDYAIGDGNLYYAARQYKGNLFCKMPLASVRPKEALAGQYHRYAVADTLTAQERKLAFAAGVDLDSEWEGEISEPKKYNRFLNAIRVHSWIPFSIEYDSISDLSSDQTLDNLRLGASVLFQNTLGNLYGMASYAYNSNKTGYKGRKKRHSFHVDLTYTGLYPVIEASIDVGQRDAIQYGRVLYQSKAFSYRRLTGAWMDQNSVQAEVKCYIPFNFSRNGWNRGLIPQIRLVSSNDCFAKKEAVFSYTESSGDLINYGMLSGFNEDKTVFMHSAYASVRGYIMRPVAHSQVYPSFGIGAEIGYHHRLGLSSLYSPSAYGYVYGYLPGLGAGQGLRLSAIGQHQFSALNLENSVKVRPRGFREVTDDFLSMYTTNQVKVTSDYAIPFWLGDISCFSPFTYIKNFVITPHADLSTFKFANSEHGNLYSVGIDLTARLANILWFPFDSDFGLSINFNGGKSFDMIKETGVPLEKTSVGFVFKTSL